jgi:hypothetical protein
MRISSGIISMIEKQTKHDSPNTYVIMLPQKLPLSLKYPYDTASNALQEKLYQTVSRL